MKFLVSYVSWATKLAPTMHVQEGPYSPSNLAFIAADTCASVSVRAEVRHHDRLQDECESHRAIPRDGARVRTSHGGACVEKSTDEALQFADGA